jgi:predicted RNA-binding Zn-ribbon protein involved in translation (DUF1610 family)
MKVNLQEGDPFRYCVYCNADCAVDESQHSGDCPTVTGLWPVRKEDLGLECPRCGYQHGMRCMDCEAEFKIGDFYIHRELDPGDPHLPGVEGAAIHEIICVGCGAKEAVS